MYSLTLTRARNSRVMMSKFIENISIHGNQSVFDHHSFIILMGKHNLPHFITNIHYLFIIDIHYLYIFGY